VDCSRDCESIIYHGEHEEYEEKYTANQHVENLVFSTIAPASPKAPTFGALTPVSLQPSVFFVVICSYVVILRYLYVLFLNYFHERLRAEKRKQVKIIDVQNKLGGIRVDMLAVAINRV
jgi:hypothetical protein